MNHTSTSFSWKEIVEPVMRLYTEATDGSYIETKESALVWHYYDADPDFGSWQAKQLLDHLECLFANEPVTMKKVYSGTSLLCKTLLFLTKLLGLGRHTITRMVSLRFWLGHEKKNEKEIVQLRNVSPFSKT